MRDTFLTSYQAIWETEAIPPIYAINYPSDLPISKEEGSVSWDLDSGDATVTYVNYEEIESWVKFTIQFVRHWSDVDWVPTFDVRLINQRYEAGQRMFMGTCTLRA